MRTDKERALALWCAFPPSCSGPASCPVDQTVTVRAARAHNHRSTLGDPCSHQTRPPREECCWWEFLIFPSPVRPQIWRCSINTSWHLRLAIAIRNAAAFLCHVDFSQKSLQFERPQKPVKNKSTTEGQTLLSGAALVSATHVNSSGCPFSIFIMKLVQMSSRGLWAGQNNSDNTVSMYMTIPTFQINFRRRSNDWPYDIECPKWFIFTRREF